MKRLIFTTLTLVIVGLLVQVFSQSTQGTDFVLAYGTLSTGNPSPQIKIVADQQTNATFTYYSTPSLNNTVTIPAGTVYTHVFTTPSDATPNEQTAITAGTTASYNSLRLHTDHPVTVYYLNATSNSGDATLILPVDSLGKDYYHISRTPNKNNIPDRYIVVATENNTVVTRHETTPVNVTLQAGQSIRYDFPTSSSIDRTGMRITSDKPIAYFVLNEEVRIIQTNITGTLFDQLPPVHTWGTAFLVPATRTGATGEYVRVLASEAGTTIKYYYGTGAPTTYTFTTAGSFTASNLITATPANAGCWIEASAPVLVASYLDYGVAPSMVWIPPVQQAIESIIAAPFTGAFANLPNHYGVVIAPTIDRDLTRVAIGTTASVPLSGGSWTTGAGPGAYSYYVMPLSTTAVPNLADGFVFSHPTGVIVLIYAAGSNSSYYYVGGVALRSQVDVFYIEEIQYDVLDGETVCFEEEVTFKAKLMHVLGTQSGSLKWYIDGVEEIGARDNMEWTKPSLSLGSHTVKLEITDALGGYYELSTTFTNYCPPQDAFPDFAITPVDTPVNIPVLNNDTYGNCDATAIELSVTTPPTSGVASLNLQQIVYTPNPGFVGLDSLDYTIDCFSKTSTARVYIYTFPNTTRLCAGSSTTVILDFSSDGASVAWYNSGSHVASIMVSSILSSVFYPYEAQVTFPAYLGSVMLTDPLAGYHVEVVPRLMYWGQTTENSNWNDPSHWMNASNVALNAVPLSCTTVHIPGNAANYPSLDTIHTPRTLSYGNPVCDSIIFHFGGEVAKPHLLTYNKAFIEYNFGYFNGSSSLTNGDLHSALPMDRGRWYALATPLNKITPGDFSFGGFPAVWQSAFVQHNNVENDFVGEWLTPHNANGTDIPETQYGSIAIWMAEELEGMIGEDPSFHTNLNDLKGIIRMPYFEDAYLSAKHRIHVYDDSEEESTFYYYWYDQWTQPIEYSQFDLIKRGNTAYRFVFDNKLTSSYSNSGGSYPAFKMTVPAGKELMIGNPFLSNLDFDLFYEINQEYLLNDTYRLYENYTWSPYTVGSGSGPFDQYIAPLQAFFIQTQGSGTVDLLFPPDLLSVTEPINKLRATRIINPYNHVLYVEAFNSEGSSWATLGMKEGISVNQLFNNDTLSVNAPQVYFSDGNRKNAVQFISGETEIPLGIRSLSIGTITLRFKNVERFRTRSLVLFDKVSGDSYDLLYGPNEIRFENIPGAPDRFLLQVGKQTVRTERIEETVKNAGIQVRMERGKLLVDAEEMIQKIMVANTQGMNSFYTPFVNTKKFSTEMNLPSGIYFVNVMLATGERKVEKVIVR